MLVSAGARIDALNDDVCDEYPIDRAIRNDHLPVVEFLFEKLPENNRRDEFGHEWIEHILSKAALHGDGKVFNAFMQNKWASLSKSQLESVLTTVIIGCCFECQYGIKRMPLYLNFMALLKAQNAKTDSALSFLQDKIAKETDTEVLTKLEEIKTKLTS